MPNLPRKKVGLISCSGEELPEGTVTRRAVRRVLETLRPEDTVTLCLPLFLAGGEEERSFARHYPTIAVDGCAKRCAARATSMYSAEPAAGIVVSEIATARGDADLGTARRLSEGGLALSEAVAQRIADETDKLLKRAQRGGTARRAGPEGEAVMARTETYEATVTWTGGHDGHLRLGNGPEMGFSAPPQSHGRAGVLTPEDAFVGAVNTCVMLMFVWAAERLRLDLVSYECRAEGLKVVELDRTERFARVTLKPRIAIRRGDEALSDVDGRVRRALESARKYSLVANSVRSEVVIEPEIIVR